MIYVDMDGVLVDLVGGLGIKPEEYDCFKAWKHLDARFWAELQPTPEYNDLIRVADVIITKVVSKYARKGKEAWLKKWAPAKRKIFTESPKSYWCTQNDILIDDSDDEIRDWIRVGGVGLLVPRPWNRGKQ